MGMLSGNNARGNASAGLSRTWWSSRSFFSRSLDARCPRMTGWPSRPQIKLRETVAAILCREIESFVPNTCANTIDFLYACYIARNRRWIRQEPTKRRSVVAFRSLSLSISISFNDNNAKAISRRTHAGKMAVSQYFCMKQSRILVLFSVMDERRINNGWKWCLQRDRNHSSFAKRHTV